MIRYRHNFPQFRVDLDRFVNKDVPKAGLQLQKDVANFLLNRLRRYTPFKTGLTVGNWRVGRTGTTQADPRDAPGGYGRFEAEKAKINRFRKPGLPIVIVNNTPYFPFLEFGIGNSDEPVTYSNRHPELGIVRISVLETKASFGF